MARTMSATTPSPKKAVRRDPLNRSNDHQERRNDRKRIAREFKIDANITMKRQLREDEEYHSSDYDVSDTDTDNSDTEDDEDSDDSSRTLGSEDTLSADEDIEENEEEEEDVIDLVPVVVQYVPGEIIDLTADDE